VLRKDIVERSQLISHLNKGSPRGSPLGANLAPRSLACAFAAFVLSITAHAAEQDFRISCARYEAASTGSAIAYKGLAMVTGTHGARWSCKFDLIIDKDKFENQDTGPGKLVLPALLSGTQASCAPYLQDQALCTPQSSSGSEGKVVTFMEGYNILAFRIRGQRMAFCLGKPSRGAADIPQCAGFTSIDTTPP
jgi:hypothetical protein